MSKQHKLQKVVAGSLPWIEEQENPVPITTEQVAAMLPKLWLAAASLLMVWDTLNEVEAALNCTIETNELMDLCAGMDRPENVPKQLTLSIAKAWVDELPRPKGQ